jgi:sorting nexin-1/2
MDEEADFANLLSQSTIQRPTWTTSDPSSDPWANPFSSSSPTNPFASSTSAFGSTSAYVPSLPQLDKEDEVSPYVSKLEEDVASGIGNLPDPPSVIAAREQEATEAEEGFGSYPVQTQDQDAFTVPYSPPRPTEEEVKVGSPTPPTRKLPSDLIDDDLMAESDPSVTLKKAFVKSTPAPKKEGKVEGKKAYVFTPAKKGGEDKKGKTPESKAAPVKDTSPVKKDTPEKKGSPVQKGKPAEEVLPVEKDETKEKVAEKVDAAPTPAPDTIKSTEEPSKEEDKEVKEPTETAIPETVAESTTTNTSETEPAQPQTSEPIRPESIPLPASGQATPSISRIASPVSANKGFLSTNDLFSPNSTPKHDRVAVSPLDPPPPAEKDYGFHHLSIGGSSQAQVAPPTKSSTGWDQPSATSSGSRFAGKGWAAVDEVDDLFGAGGPSVRSDPWGGSGDGEGWAGDNVPTMSGPSQVSRPSCVVEF